MPEKLELLNGNNKNFNCIIYSFVLFKQVQNKSLFYKIIKADYDLASKPKSFLQQNKETFKTLFRFLQYGQSSTCESSGYTYLVLQIDIPITFQKVK